MTSGTHKSIFKMHLTVYLTTQEVMRERKKKTKTCHIFLGSIWIIWDPGNVIECLYSCWQLLVTQSFIYSALPFKKNWDPTLAQLIFKCLTVQVRDTDNKHNCLHNQ